MILPPYPWPNKSWNTSTVWLLKQVKNSPPSMDLFPTGDVVSTRMDHHDEIVRSLLLHLLVLSVLLQGALVASSLSLLSLLIVLEALTALSTWNSIQSLMTLHDAKDSIRQAYQKQYIEREVYDTWMRFLSTGGKSLLPVMTFRPPHTYACRQCFNAIQRMRSARPST